MRRWRDAAQCSVCRFEYATDLFEAATIGCLAGQFQHLVEAIAARPAAAISQLALPEPAQRSQLLSWGLQASAYLSGDLVAALTGAARSGAGGDPVEGLQGYVLDRWLGLEACRGCGGRGVRGAQHR